MAEIDKKQILKEIEELARISYIAERKVYYAFQLAPLMEKRAERFEYDRTIQQVNRVVTELANKDPYREVSAKDLKNIASRFYDFNSNFKEVFADLLEDVKEDAKKEVTTKVDFQLLERELSEVKKEKEAFYSPSNSITCKYADILVRECFKKAGVNKFELKFACHNEDLLMFQALIPTERNEKIEVVIPVEMKEGMPLEPDCLINNENVYSFDESGIEDVVNDLFITKEKRRANALDSLRRDLGMTIEDKGINEKIEEVDEFEDIPETKINKLDDEELESILREAVLSKKTKYNKKLLSIANQVVEMKIKEAGYKNPIIRFAGDIEEGVKYKVEFNSEFGKLKAEIPVEINDQEQIFEPEIISIANKNYEFSRNGIKLSQKEDNFISPKLYSLSYSDLRKQLKKAAYSKQSKVAKQIIALVQEKFDNYYSNAIIDDYQVWLEESQSDPNKKERLVYENDPISISNEITIKL